jgi:hypothetical protein
MDKSEEKLIRQLQESNCLKKSFMFKEWING